MRFYPNILSILGEGQNVSKTFLAEKIIAKFSRHHRVVGLKITPHMHGNTANAQIVATRVQSVLMLETELHSKKDTGRMLAAGAERAYLLQTVDEELDLAVELFLNEIDDTTLVVCESGKLASQAQTGVNLFVRRLCCRVVSLDKKLPNKEHYRIVTFSGMDHDINLDHLKVVNHAWQLTEPITPNE